MEQFLVLVLVVLVIVYICYCAKNESFYIPPSIVSGGDFHIQPVGAIADQGSFATDMQSYMDQSSGPI